MFNQEVYQKRSTLPVLLMLVVTVTSVLVACGGKPSIKGKWEQVSSEAALIFFGGTGTLWEFFDDGTVSIGVMGNISGKYSWPDSSHLKIEFAQGLGIVYEFSRSGDEITLKDPSTQELIVLKRYTELPPNSQSLAGRWEKQNPDDSKCFLSMGLEDAPDKIDFGRDGTFSVQATFVSMYGQYFVKDNFLTISATGTKTETIDLGFFSMGGQTQTPIGGELKCEVSVSHSRLLLKDEQGQITLYVRAHWTEHNKLSPATLTPPEVPFMGVQMGGGAQNPLQSRPSYPSDYCNVTNRQGVREPPVPFLYQPFEGSLDEQTWTAQMDHDQPNYQQNGIVATLGESLRYDAVGPGLAGGTEAYGTSGKQWFKPNVPYANVIQQGYHILAYQSPSFETYLYYDGHDGHDFAVTGKALAAADGGVVFKGDYGNALGRVVEIYHPNGYLTRYAHLASFESGIEVGTQVKAGQPIGTIGGSAVVDGKLTDNYWGTHLHFSVFRWAGSEWHTTDPFGWDPWAGPDQQSHLRKQREDPLVHCNGEVSYNLWVGGWPKSVNEAKTSTKFYPTQDRYVGGWLGEPSPGISQEPNFAQLPVLILPFDYQEKTVGNGWKIAVVRLLFVNTSNNLLSPQTLYVTNAYVETLEGKTYPADLIDPTSWYAPRLGSHREFLEKALAEGRFDWSEPKNIFLGEAAIGGKLGIPSGFPFINAPAGFGSYEYGIGFRFAETATPVRVTLQLVKHGDVSIELRDVLQSVPDPSPEDVHARPIKNLSELRMSNEKYTFAWEGTCVWRIEGLVRNKMIYIPYHAVNKNAFDEQTISFSFPHAVYYSGGTIYYSEEPFEITLGPSQEIRDLYLIALLINENDPMPQYLILYKDNNIETFQLECQKQ